LSKLYPLKIYEISFLANKLDLDSFKAPKLFEYIFYRDFLEKGKAWLSEGKTHKGKGN
jgi:hypothetical protein